MPSHVLDVMCGIPCALRRMTALGPLAALAAVVAAASNATASSATTSGARRAALRTSPLTPDMPLPRYNGAGRRGAAWSAGERLAERAHAVGGRLHAGAREPIGAHRVDQLAR